MGHRQQAKLVILSGFCALFCSVFALKANMDKCSDSQLVKKVESKDDPVLKHKLRGHNFTAPDIDPKDSIKSKIKKAVNKKPKPPTGVRRKKPTNTIYVVDTVYINCD